MNRGRIALAACSAAVAVGWLVILPWLSSLPGQKAYIEWLRENRIDPSARYYTEVEAMEPILERLNAELTGRTVAAAGSNPARTPLQP